MDDETLQEQELDPRDKVINDLKAENAQYRGKVRTAEAQRLKALYGVDIEPDDLKGTDAAVLEKVLQQTATRQSAAAAVTPEAASRPEAPEAQTLAQAQDLSGPPGTPQKKFTYEEAKQLPWNERSKAIEQGLVEGVEVPIIRHQH